MKRFLNMVADIFYPRCCPVCQKILADQRRMICPECEKELRPIGHPRCYKMWKAHRNRGILQGLSETQACV